MSVLEANHVTLKRGAKYILRDVSWSIQPGERWVLFGVNGSGKTSLLSMFAGYYSPTDGDLLLHGEVPDEANILSLRKRIGWASASFFDRYYSTESIMDIVLSGKTGSLCCDYEEISDADIRRAKHLLTKFGMERNMRYSYDMLSHGQRQKVLVARAFMSDADVLLLDEPCNGMDILSRELLLHELGQLLKERTIALIYVTHHTDEILPFFDKAFLLKKGEMFAQGSLREMFTQEKMDAFFEVKTDVAWNDDNLSIHLCMA